MKGKKSKSTLFDCLDKINSKVKADCKNNDNIMWIKAPHTGLMYPLDISGFNPSKK